MALFSNTCALSPQILLSSRGGILVGPQIRELLKDKDFEELLTLKELRGWKQFKTICHCFLANMRVLDSQERIEKLLESYEDTGCRMSLKINFPHSYLNFFPLDLGVVNYEYGERLDLDITKMESN